MVDRERIKVYYRELKNKSVKTVELDQYCDIPTVTKVRESLLGVVSAKEFVKLISDGDGNLSRGIFFENVRDFQGMNQVNQEIYDTIRDECRSDRFCLLNNGVTIVARDLLKTGKVFRLTDFQIVNGCQTSNILYSARNLVSDAVHLPVRIIVTDDIDVISEIVYANNRQTTVLQEAFHSLTPFHKDLEEYYRACRGEDKRPLLYYERRSKQYSGQDVRPVDVITPSAQIKSFIAVFLEEPHSCDEYYGQSLSKFQGAMFVDGHSFAPYHTSALIWNLVEKKYRGGGLRGIQKRFRPHLALLIRRALGGEDLPNMLSAKKMEAYCASLRRELLHPESFEPALRSAIQSVKNAIDSEASGFRSLHQKKAFTRALCGSAQERGPNSTKSEDDSHLNEEKEYFEDPYLLSGKVERYNPKRGFGFIRSEGNNKLYFHISSVNDKPRSGEPLPGQRVYFYEEFSTPLNVARKVSRSP